MGDDGASRRPSSTPSIRQRGIRWCCSSTSFISTVESPLINLCIPPGEKATYGFPQAGIIAPKYPIFHLLPGGHCTNGHPQNVLGSGKWVWLPPESPTPRSVGTAAQRWQGLRAGGIFWRGLCIWQLGDLHWLSTVRTLRHCYKFFFLTGPSQGVDVWSPGPGCPGRLWSLLLWRYSRPTGTRCCAACSGWPCLGRGLGWVTHRGPFQPPPFCDSVKTFVFPCLQQCQAVTVWAEISMARCPPQAHRLCLICREGWMRRGGDSRAVRCFGFFLAEIAADIFSHFQDWG